MVRYGKSARILSMRPSKSVWNAAMCHLPIKVLRACVGEGFAKTEIKIKLSGILPFLLK
jgi:hypothetical protein